MTEEDEDEAYEEPGDLARNSISQIVSEFSKKHHHNFYLSVEPMPHCCSGLVLGGAYMPSHATPAEQIKQEDLAKVLADILAAASDNFSWVMSTLLMGSQGRWAEALVAAGFEESKQVAASNSYNGPQPIKVFIKALRPMQAKEVEDAMQDYKKKSEYRRKGGYE